MKTRFFVAYVLVFMIFLSFMLSGTAPAYNLDGMAPASARDIPVLRFNVIDIIKIVFDVLSPTLGPFVG